MRKIILGALALLIALPADANNAVGKTYLTNRDVFQATSPERLTFDRTDRMYRKDDGYKGDFSATGIFVRSHDEQNLRDYFLPQIGVKSLIAGEFGSTAAQNNTIDVVANYFNLFTSNVTNGGSILNCTFQSILNFKPQQTMAGVGLQWQQSFRRYFFKASAPIMHIKNDLGMQEDITNAGAGAPPAGAVTTMTAAFKQAALKYGKIDGAQEKWGVADVELIFGREWFGDQICQMSAFVGVVCPTGNRPEAKYLWEAVVGNNHHWGAFFGSSSSYVWREGDNYVMSVYCDTDARYLFENTQTRMIDLNGRPWSRYLYLANVNSTYTASGTPTTLFAEGLNFGVNFLTQQVRVAPHGSFSINSALNYRRDGGLEAEGGVNFYARQDEKVKLRNKFSNPNNYGIPALVDDLNLGNWNKTVSFATINNAQTQNADINYDGSTYPSIVIQESDLDLNSASTPAVLESTIYGVIGKNWDDLRFPAFLGAGGAYTYNSNNASIQRWGVWGKAGLAF